MTGPEHYQAAERLLSEVAESPHNLLAPVVLASAQVHAALALAAATAGATAHSMAAWIATSEPQQ
jgi:hypothetical protein